MRKSFFITAFLITAALGSLLLLAFNQFQLYGRHEQMISQTEKLIFQYSTIREQIIEYIVEGRKDELVQVSPAVEELNNSILNILDNTLIPAEYKFSFMQQIDLPGLVLLLRRSGTDKEDDNLLRLINEETRVIGERFMLLERLILGYAKQKLVDFQLVIIGTLAVVVFLVTTLMVVTYRLLIMPVINLSVQADNILLGGQDKLQSPRGWHMVINLAEKMNRMLHEVKRSRESSNRFEQVLRCCQNVAEKIHEVKKADELYQTVCRSLLRNPDYLLAWVGIEEGAGESIIPVAEDGSSTMTGDECQECFCALLAAQEGDEDPTKLAIRSGKTVIRENILAHAPKGPFKNTPMANGVVDSISLPIVIDRKTFGVLTVYVMAAGGILDQEAAMLTEIAAMLAAKADYFNIRRKLDLEKAVKNLIGEKSDIIVFVLNQDGRVLSVDTYLENSSIRDAASKWIGGRISDIVIPESDPEKIVLHSSLAEGKNYDFNARINGMDGIFTAILAPVNRFPADDVTLLLVLIPPKKNILIQPENFQVAYAAAIGQFASTIAHEITDQSNGIINYAQMLSDEIGGNAENERKQFLKKIIDGGEKVAAVVEPLLVDQQHVEFSSEMEEVQRIFDKVFMLTGHLLRRDGIQVDVDVKPPSLKYRSQYLQLILLTVLNHLREILNKHYPQRDPDKALHFAVTKFDEGGREMIRMAVTLPCGEEECLQEDASPDYPTGLWLSKELTKNLGGEMKISTAGNGRVNMELILPS